MYAVEAVRLLGVAPHELRTVGQLRRACDTAVGDEPDAIEALGTELGVDDVYRRFDSRGSYEAVFNPRWETATGPRADAGDRHRQFASSAPRQAPARALVDLDEHLRRVLPDYMVPAAIVTLDRIPLTHNGKVNYRSLPSAVFVSSRAYDPPRTSQEERLCRLFEEVLRTAPVGIH